jgi:serine/threonine protein phosphatase PrpC
MHHSWKACVGPVTDAHNTLCALLMLLPTGVYPFSDCTKDNPEVHTVLEHGYGRQELAAAVASEGLRPLLPKAAPEGYRQLLTACWQLDPEQRPTAAAVRDAVAALLQQLGAGGPSSPNQQQQQAAHAGDWSSWQQSVAHEMGGTSSPGSAGNRCSDASAGSTFMAGQPTTPAVMGSFHQAFRQQQQQHQQHDMEGILHEQEQQGLPKDLGLDWVCSSDHSSLCPMEVDSPGWRTPLSTAAAAGRAASPALKGALLPLSDALTATAAAFPAPEDLQVAAGVYAAMGPRDTMEDRHVVIRGLGGDPRLHFAGVFDGHRGAQAAHYAALHLPRALQVAAVKALAQQRSQGASSSSQGGSSPPAGAAASSSSSGRSSAQEAAVAAAVAALKDSFLTVDAGFHKEWQQEMAAKARRSNAKEPYPGTTALAAVIAGGMLLVANAGDSRAVLSRGGRAIGLSRQHTAELPDERARIEAAGGKVVSRGGSWRVGDAALQVTRALGDFDLKASDGVTAEPEVVEVPLQEDDQFLILASDGLWDVVSDQEAVGLVMDTVKDPSLCAKRLVLEAMSRSSQDNVSIAIIFLQPVSTLEKVWVRGAGVAAPEATDTFYGTRRKTLQAATGKAPPGAADTGVSKDEMQDTY